MIEVTFKVSDDKDTEQAFVEFAENLAKLCNGGSSRTLGILDKSGGEDHIKWSFDGDGSTRIEVSVKSGVDESSEDSDRIKGILNSFGYYVISHRDERYGGNTFDVYANEKSAEKFSLAGSQWMHSSGTQGRGAEALGEFLSQRHGGVSETARRIIGNYLFPSCTPK